jgi:hypothetical protein
VFLPLALGAFAGASADAQQVTPEAEPRYHVGISAGWVRSWENPYHSANFGFEVDAVVGRFVATDWLIGIGGRFGEHAVLADSLLGSLRFAGAGAEVRRYVGASADTTRRGVQSFIGARFGYLRASGPGTGARGGGGEIVLLTGLDIASLRGPILEVTVHQALQIVDGRFAGQFSVHVGLAARVGAP